MAAPETAGSDGPDPTAVPRRTVLRLQLIAAAAGALTLTWVVMVLLTVGRSFAESDEGFYLLLYRWWDELPPNFTGIGYFYGPVFDLLGHNIVAMRIFRLLTILATHAVFGWAFMAWLRTRRRMAPATRWWEIAGAATLVACGGILYGWLPLTPGYNDIATLGGLLAAAIVLRMITAIEVGTRIPAWLPALLGPVVVYLTLAKWSSAISTCAVIGLVGIIALGRHGWREVGRAVAWVGAGILATFLVAQLLLAPLASILVGILRVNQQLAQGSARSTLLVYRDQIFDFGGQAVQANAVLLLASVLVVVVRHRSLRLAAAGLAVAGGALSAYHLLADGLYLGGGIHGTQFTIALIGLLLVPAVVWITSGVRDRIAQDHGSSLTRPGGRSWAVLIMLVLLPIAQAGGSSTGLLGVAIDSLAAWVAVVIAVVTGLEAAPLAARWVTFAAGAATVAVCASIAATGLWRYPYASPHQALATSDVPGVPALAGIRVTPDKAHAYANLYRSLRPYLDPPGRAMMAFDEIAGVVLLLDGRPLGEAWVGAADPTRAAMSQRAECESPDRWWGERAPILLFDRPMTQIEVETLRICGYDFDTDYRLLAPRQETGGLDVYVPVAG